MKKILLIYLLIYFCIIISINAQQPKNDSLKCFANQNKTGESDFSRPAIDLSPNQKYFIYYGLDNSIDIYDTRTLYVVNQIKTERTGIYFQEIRSAFFIDDKSLLVETNDNVFIYNIYTINCEFDFSKKNKNLLFNNLKDIVITIDEKTLFINNLLVWESEYANEDNVIISSISGNWVVKFSETKDGLICFNKIIEKTYTLNQDDPHEVPFCFNKKETLFFYGTKNFSGINCIDLLTGKEFSLSDSDLISYASTCDYLDANSELIIAGQDGYASTMFVCINIFNGRKRTFNGQTILPDLKFGSNDFSIGLINTIDSTESFVWDLKKCSLNSIYNNSKGSLMECSELVFENLIKQINQPNNHCYQLGSFNLFFGKNHSLYVVDNSNNVIYEVIFFKNKNWLVKLPHSPYYMCSKDASKMLHYVTPNFKVIGFEQLDPVYNRPDIVLDSIGKYFGGTDQELVANYRQSWEKRIDRLGLDKDKLGKGEISVPNAEIVGADNIAYENNNGQLNLKVAANDPKYSLRRFNVFVNEVPLYGSAGISIASLKKQEWDTTLSVPLSTGENKIQVSVMNELGLENFKYPTFVNYIPTETITAKTYYIGIGVNEFKESSHNLKYCVKDVTDLAKSFGGPNTEVKLLTNTQVNKENILALKDYLNKTSVNDKVIISCSSHGLLDDSLNFYLAMHDVDFKHPQFKGLKYEDLESLLDGIPARQKLLLLDACNSGENDKTEVLKQELKQKESKMESNQLLAARGVIIQLEEENKSNFKKMNELFVNVRNNTGSVIISAAGGQERAFEAIEVNGRAIENGAFTYSVLECLEQNKGKELKVNTLKQYTEKRVDEITKGKQKPTSRQETMEVDWDIFLH